MIDQQTTTIVFMTIFCVSVVALILIIWTSTRRK